MNETLALKRDDLELLSIRNVTELFGISRHSVLRLIERGLVPVYRVLSCVRFKRSDITNFLAKNCTPAWRDELYGREKD
jgi:excisionase family DNA binding protein